jgi:hypothetical protein
VLHLLSDDGEAVRQHLTANIADFFCHDDVSNSPFSWQSGGLLWLAEVREKFRRGKLVLLLHI